MVNFLFRNLRRGVEKYGEGNWSKIHSDMSLSFHPCRTQIDLKDKWRNLANYVRYSEHPIRKFVLLDSDHKPILNPSGLPRYYNNRWPRDAAMKIASKDEFYPKDLNGQTIESSILIFLREVKDGNPFETDSAIVHVYKGTRALEPAINIPKFEGYSSIWVANVEKFREEQLIMTSE